MAEGKPHDHRHRGLQAHGARTIDGWRSRVYDRMARLQGRTNRRIAEEVAAHAPRGGRVLDVGTGPGLLLVELARQRPDLELAGFDLSADMVRLAERNIARAPRPDRIDIRRADVADLPYPDASFDVVVAVMSLHHWQDVDRGLAEVARVLRPGGRLVIHELRRTPTDVLAEAIGEAFPGSSPTITPVRGRLLPWTLRHRAELTRTA